MAPATLIDPADEFDPLDELLNSRYEELNTDIAKLKSVMTQPVPGVFVSTNASISGTLVAIRTGGTVMLNGELAIGVANYIASTSKRLICTLAPAFRPSDTVISALQGPDAGTPSMSRLARLEVSTTGQVYLSHYGLSTHIAGIKIEVGAAFVTGAAHPAL